MAVDYPEPVRALIAQLKRLPGIGPKSAERIAIWLMQRGADVTSPFSEALEKAGPFGQGAPAPRFALPSVEISHSRRIGEAHLRLTLSDGMSARLEAVAFNAFTGPLGPFLEAVRGRRAHVAGRLELNHWQGRTTVQLRLEDAAET